MTNRPIVIDADDLSSAELNHNIKEQVNQGENYFVLENVNGHRYIGTGIKEQITIDINGVPGSDLAAFLYGSKINVYGNGQELIGNTMDSGEISIHGNATDVIGMGMRGGEIFIQGDVGYRVGIHMKSFAQKSPAIIIGGVAVDFLGEYMAGGTIVVLGLDNDMDNEADAPVAGNFIGTGMHGGVMYLRGTVHEDQLGKEVAFEALEKEDFEELTRYIQEYENRFNLDLSCVHTNEFTKIVPKSHKPYGQLYVS